MPRINDVHRILELKGSTLCNATLETMRWRALQEMNDRSVSGNAVLALAFIFIGLNSTLAQTHTILFYGLFSLVALSISARLIVMALIKWGKKTIHLASESHFYLTVISFAVTWGILAATMMFIYETAWSALIVVLFTAGMGAGALSNFCIWRPLVWSYLIVLFMPVIAVCISIGGTEAYVVGAGLTLFMGYLLIQVGLWNNEFWTSRINNELLAIRAIELQDERETSEAANRAKSDFLSSMSHELRTPMNAILGFAQMLEFNPKEPLTKTQSVSVKHILKGGNHLLELIDQVLELNKIEAGKLAMNIEQVSPHDVINESLNLIESRAKKEQIEVFDQTAGLDLPLLMTDSTRLTQVLLNLLSNAVKYNRIGGTVTLTCHKVPEDMLRICVIDTGSGIPVDKRGDLFKPFERLGHEVGEIEGTGIGLTITKQIVEFMGGRVGFTSDENTGSTFWIDIPISNEPVPVRQEFKEKTEPEQYVEPEDNNLPVRSILYVEDNPDNLQLMKTIIRQIGNIKLQTAFNAELGLEMATNDPPDLILMDINLPGMNGIEALEILQNTTEVKGIPVIAITAAAMPKDVEAGMNAGFNDYITKPFNVPEFVRIIKEVLEGNKQPD